MLDKSHQSKNYLRALGVFQCGNSRKPWML